MGNLYETTPIYKTNGFKIGLGVAIVTGAAVGSSIGVVSGGLIGGITAETKGGNFIDGFAEGMLVGANGVTDSAIYAGETAYQGGEIKPQGLAVSFLTGAVLSGVTRISVGKYGKSRRIESGIDTSWYKPDGSINYPPNNGAVPGTEINMTLKPGGTLGRYGNIGEKSNFVTQTGADACKLALPPNTNPTIYQEYEVIKEIPGTIQAEIAPWGGSAGGGVQYELPKPILQLIKEGYIVPK
ncbi:MAG: TNT domain-containing protein [Lachnospiraceae bacterium]|nr:TNT domain-containing protein [Lachnospiraceae bacterium]